jgi:hypothetical protein
MALPNLTAHDEKATADIVRAALALLEEMGLRDRDLLACYQMLETFSVGGNAYEFADYPQAHDRRLRSRRLVGHEVTARYSADVAQVAEIDDVAFEIAAGALLDACEERGRRTHEG